MDGQLDRSLAKNLSLFIHLGWGVALVRLLKYSSNSACIAATRMLSGTPGMSE